MKGLWALLPALLVFACQDETVFTQGHELQVCEDSIPSACGATARCVLDTGHYIEGQFPGGVQFVINTLGDTDLHFDLELDNRLSPGTFLRLQISEPACVEKSLYDSGGKDLFQNADSNGVITVPMRAHLPGDHLVQVSSDAYCSFKLRYE